MITSTISGSDLRRTCFIGLAIFFSDQHWTIISRLLTIIKISAIIMSDFNFNIYTAKLERRYDLCISLC